MTEVNLDTNASTTVLQATGLHRTYRMGRVEVPVLRGVDLQVQEGEWLCVSHHHLVQPCAPCTEASADNRFLELQC